MSSGFHILINISDLQRETLHFLLDSFSWILVWIRCRTFGHTDRKSRHCQVSYRNSERKKKSACVWSRVVETKAHKSSLSFHAWSFPYVPLALLPIHHISLWARQLSGAEAYSQFSSPSNCTKYSNSSVKLEQGVEGWEAKSVKEAELCWGTLPTLTLWTLGGFMTWSLRIQCASPAKRSSASGCVNADLREDYNT